jgi:SAM-dependent methyltransferase
MDLPARYDDIGRGYTHTRRPDPRIARLISDALGDARTIVNVGAGAGSYEPWGRRVFALEPSWVMISQRDRSRASTVRGVAERLPFRDGAVDAAMAILTMHHWSDPVRGLAEMDRIARKIVVATVDTDVAASFWLMSYFPEIARWDEDHFLELDAAGARFSDPSVTTIPIPHDCQDGFLAAYWRRPHAYLDPDVRAGISTFAFIDEEARDSGLQQLKEDLDDGVWERRFGHLRQLQELDAGYRLIVASSR